MTQKNYESISANNTSIKQSGGTSVNDQTNVTSAEEYVNMEVPEEGVYWMESQTRTAQKIKEENLEYVNEHSAPVHPRNTFYAKYGKRILDIVLSAAALIVLLPVNTVLLICTWIDVGRPLLFRQKRIGKDEKPFMLVKFRNMTNECDENGDLLPADQRVTRFGRFVRRTSLDELLNFWSILKGDMSVIGPRPLPEGYLDRFSERHRARFAVRPGLECPRLNVSGNGSTWNERFDNDVYYVEHVSFALDVKLFFLLVKMVFDPKTRAIREDGVSGSFLGYEKNGRCINSLEVPVKYVQYIYNEETV